MLNVHESLLSPSLILASRLASPPLPQRQVSPGASVRYRGWRNTIYEATTEETNRAAKYNL